MIRSFRHKGLARLFAAGSGRGIGAAHGARIERMLDRLDAAVTPGDMNVPGWRFHALHAGRTPRYAVTVSGNFRMTFAFDGEDAVAVDLEDYH